MIEILLFFLFPQALAASPLCTELSEAVPLTDYKRVIWTETINAEGDKAALIESKSCDNGECEAGLYLSCGKGKYYELIERDFGLSGIKLSKANSPFVQGWKNILGSKLTQSESVQNDINDPIDLKHDGNDILSKERHFNEQAYLAEYKSSGLGSPGNLPGEYIFTGLKYEKFYSDPELEYLLRLVDLGDPQAAHILYFEVLRKPSNHPSYLKYQALLEETVNLRKLYKTGFQVLPRFVESEHLLDPEIRRYYVRANIANLEAESVRKLLSEDLSLALAVVQYSGDNLLHLPEEFVRNPQLVEAAIKENRSAIANVDGSLLKDKERILSWCKQYKITARFLHPSLLGDGEVADACIEARPINYQFFSEKIRSDRELAKKTILRDGFMFKYAPEELRKDPELIKIALERYPAARDHIDKVILKKLNIEK